MYLANRVVQLFPKRLVYAATQQRYCSMQFAAELRRANLLKAAKPPAFYNSLRANISRELAYCRR
jgi:hypothetical protein